MEFARTLAEALPASGRAVEAPGAAVERAGLRARWASFLDTLRAPSWTLGISLATMLLLVIGGVWVMKEVRRTQSEQLQAGQQPPPQRREDSGQTGVAGETSTPAPESGGQMAQRAPGEEERAALDEAGHSQGRPGGPERIPERKARAPRPVIAAFVFAPGMARNSGESRQLVVSEKAQVVRLRLELERGDEYGSYGAELRTAGGRLVWQRKAARARQRASRPSVVLDVPAKLLTSGGYELKLTGAVSTGPSEELGYYYFTILKQ